MIYEVSGGAVITEGTAVLVSVAIILILLRGLFVLTEFSLIRLRFSHFNQELLEELHKIRSISGLLQQTDRVLRFLRLAAMVTTIAMGVILLPLLESVRYAIGGIDATPAFLAYYVISVLFLVSLHHVLGLLIPRGIALQNPVGVMKATSWIVWSLVMLSYPFQTVFDGFTRTVLRLFRLDPNVSINKLDLETQIKNLDEESEMPDFTQRVFKNVISMRDLVVQDVMLPRNQIQYFDIYDGNEVNVALSREAGHTRYPLCEDDLDNCLGIIHIKDLYRSDLETLRMDLKKLARPVEYVGPDDQLESVLEQLLESKQHMALVRDEFGGTVGAITMENIVEELVGNIQDEFDSEAEQIEEVQEDVFIVDGLTPIHDVEEKLDMDIEEDEVSTIGGLITAELGRIPDAGQTIRRKNLEIEVVEVDEKRVLTARVKVVPEDTGET